MKFLNMGALLLELLEISGDMLSVSLRAGGAESASLSPGFVGFPQVSSFTCSEMISACSPQKTVKLESNSPNISMETRCIVITGSNGEG